MTKLILSLSLVVLGISFGYFFQRLVNQKIIHLKGGLPPLRKRLQQIALLVFNPIAIIGATWSANLQNLSLIALPFLCVSALFLGGAMAYLFSRFFGMDREQTGAFIVCGSFTNIGSLGALFCFMFLGEAGFALVPFYKLFEEFSYFAFGFPMAKSFSKDAAEKERFGKRLKSVFTDIFVVMAVGAITLGFSLNLSGLPRPEFYTPLNTFLIPATAFLLLLSIGMGMRFASVFKHLSPALSIALIKFILLPLLITGMGLLLGLHTIDQGLPLKVVLILSSMPVGFIAMIPPALYDLDVDLANSCWLVTNGLLLFEIPLLLLFINNY